MYGVDLRLVLIIILIPTPRLKGFCKNILCLIFLKKLGIQCHKLATEKEKKKKKFLL